MKKIYALFTFILLGLSAFAQNCSVQTQTTPCTCFGVCNGTATAFPNGTAPFAYNWVGTGQTTQTATGLCAGTYSIIVIDATGCTAINTYQITQPSQINVTCTGQNPSNCINCNGMVICTANGGTPGYTYLWQPSNCTGTTCTGLCGGTYTVTVTDAQGCTRTGTWTLQNPTGPSFTTSFTTATGPNCNNGTATATPGSPGNYTYSWSPITQTTQTATGLSQGVYTVCMTNTGNGCSSCQVVTIPCTTNIYENDANADVSLYPNPANDHLTIIYTSENEGMVDVQIINIVGEKIYEQHISSSKQFTKQIDVSNYAKGIYLLKISNTQGSITRKLIID